MLMKNNFLQNFVNKINKEKEISPILFIGEDLVSLNIEISQFINSLLEEFKVPSSSVYKFEDDGNNLKIETSREIISLLSKKSSFKFQIILIENISRFTLGAANSLLKVFEEPWEGNLIFLTNSWENNILETILSRVSIINLNSKKNFLIDENISNLIENYLEYDNPELLVYLYENSKKFEKADYLKIIDNFIEFSKKNPKYFYLLEKFLELKDLHIKNNLSLKYGLDKILL